ncbi:MAG TPA: AraC family transcriptional regulator [Cellulomonas sp.]
MIQLASGSPELDPLGYLGLEFGADEESLLIASNWIEPEPDQVWDRHRHPDHELLWGVDGTVLVEVEGERFLVPPVHGLWIPGGTPHRVVNQTATRLNCTWLSPGFTPWSGQEVVALPLSTLLRDVLRHLQMPDAPTGSVLARRRRAELFAFDLLDGELDAAWSLPMPTSPALRLLAEAMQERPAQEWSVEVAAQLARTSERTLRRRFQVETGMGFAQWRRRLRVHTAIALLRRGATVEAAARQCGYRSASAFTHAYRSVTGLAPITHVRRVLR